jgi:hypothetical protein
MKLRSRLDWVTHGAPDQNELQCETISQKAHTQEKKSVHVYKWQKFWEGN